QGYANILRDRQFLFLPWRAAPGHRFLPGSKALARRQPVTVVAYGHRPLRSSRPGHGLRQVAPPQDQIIARAPGNRDDQSAHHLVLERASGRDQRLQLVVGYNPAGGGGVERGYQGTELFFAWRRAARPVFAIDERARSVV